MDIKSLNRIDNVINLTSILTVLAGSISLTIALKYLYGHQPTKKTTTHFNEQRW